MKMKGFRVVPLTGEREIPREIGEVHHLTLSFERAEWWSKRLGNEDPSWVPLAYQYTAYGFAIMEVEAEECIPDTKSNPELDFCGRILSAKLIILQRRERWTPRQPWWEKIKGRGGE